MAVKKSAKGEEVPVAVPEVKKELGKKPRSEVWVATGWVLLLFVGLAHMLPEQMSPLLKWSVWGVSLQMAVGVAAVVLALNFLLED